MSSNQRKTIIAGNWKMHKTRKEAGELARAIVDGVKGERDLPVIVLIPPFTSLQDVLETVKGSAIQVGAQNMDYRDSGAFTGEVSAPMLVDLGVKYVLIGHSERRQFFGETNSSVNLKLKAALKHGLIPIVCVGESLDERESGLTDSVVRRQVAAALQDLNAEDLAPVVFAYEPVWAIGTGKNCEAKEAARVLQAIRTTITELFNSPERGERVENVGKDIPVLYGGSVKPSNIDEQMAEPEIDGSLVGGASLTSTEFVPIIKAAQKRVRLAVSKI